jgi:hypothetical protein
MSQRNATRLGLRLLGLVVVLAICGLTIHSGDAVAALSGCVGPGSTIYFSDAHHTTIVGRCSEGCCGCPGNPCVCNCTGTITAFHETAITQCVNICNIGP